MAKQTTNEIYYKDWQANADLKGVVVLVHGMGEHCERYDEMAGVLNQAGYAVYSMDLPGHGQSGGKRGHIDRFSDYMTAVLGLHQRALAAHPNVPIHLLGHSMGGLIAAQVLLDHQQLFKSGMLSGAAIESPQAPQASQLAIMRFLSRFVPKMPVMSLEAKDISRDPLVVAKYMEDPLVNKGKLSSRMLAELMASMDDLKDRAAKINIPLFIMHGSGDVMTSPAGSELLHQTISSEDKALKIYPGLFHEIFNEPERQEVYADVISWLDNHA